MVHVISFILTLSMFSLSIIDINGKWKGILQGPEGDMEVVFIFKVNGDTLTGTAQAPMGDLAIINGKMDGDKFSFDVDVNDMIINHQCTILGDSIVMKIPEMQGEEEILLKRLTEKE